MASLIAIVDVKGKSLIQRSYRDDVSPSAIERFLPLLLDLEDEAGGSAVPPCFTSEGINYMYIRHNNLYCAPRYSTASVCIYTMLTCLQC